MSLLSNSNAISSGYTINNSLRFRASATPYMSRTFVTPTSLQKWAWSGWVKLGAYTGAEMALQGLTTGTGPTSNLKIGSLALQPISNGYQLYFTYYQQAATQYYFQTTAILRDPSAWYHFFVCTDTTQATSTNIFNVYINGVRQTSFAAYVAPPQNYNSLCWNTANTHYIGNYFGNGVLSYQLDGYMAEVQYFDGQTIYTDTAGTLSTTFNVNKFGQTDPATGAWIPVAPNFSTATYGNNGYYLKFSSPLLTSNFNIGLGQDYSGKGNYWNNIQGISVTAGTTYDSMTDVPTLSSPVTANYAVLNPIYSTTYAGNVLAANLQINSPTTDGFCPSTIAVSSGKWYYEATMTNSTAASFIYGIVKTTAAQAELRNVGTGNGYSYLASTGVKSDGSGGAGTAYGATFTTNDVMGCAFDLDSGSITFYKNGVSQGVAYTGISGEFMAAIGDAASGSGGQTAAVNFGQRPFSYTPPTGYKALNTFNLPTPTILQGNKYMDATLYSGNSSTQTITNAAGFKPDLIWIKSRSNIEDNVFSDSVRGATKYLVSNTTAAEVTDATAVTSFNSNGWTMGSFNQINFGTGPATYVGWQWQAGQGSTSSNTQGSITSTVSVNASTGFSVVTYTGTGANATVGHGLGVAPKMVIVKSRSTGRPWPIYHNSIGNTQYLILNTTAAAVTASTYWNNTSPSSSVFSIGTDANVNALDPFVAYCWAEIAGFSKFGSYTGNGSADGPFVYTGFRPKFILYKATQTADAWQIYDTSRNIYNAVDLALFPYLANAETDTTSLGREMDILSNGFKVRGSDAQINTNGNTYIYMAFAENPFKYSNAR